MRKGGLDWLSGEGGNSVSKLFLARATKHLFNTFIGLNNTFGNVFKSFHGKNFDT